jgi:hypothetical protein
VIGHELGESLVAADHDDVIAERARGLHVGGDDMRFVGRLDDVKAHRAQQTRQGRELLLQQRWPARRIRVRADHGDRVRRNLELDHAVDRARDGEQGIHRVACWRAPIRRHDEVAARQQIRGRGNERAVHATATRLPQAPLRACWRCTLRM